MQLKNRSQAGKLLAEELLKFKDNPNVIILGLPRGGVEVAAPVARFLLAPLDVILVRKIGHPDNPELAVGAVCENGESYFDKYLISDVPWSRIEPIIDQERETIKKRQKLYRGDQTLPNLKRKIVVLVDDGLATGATMRLAIAAVRKEKPSRVVVAVPVASFQASSAIKKLADESVILYIPETFYAVGQFYDEFEQTTDERVFELLEESKI